MQEEENHADKSKRSRQENRINEKEPIIVGEGEGAELVGAVEGS